MNKTTNINKFRQTVHDTLNNFNHRKMILPPKLNRSPIPEIKPTKYKVNRLFLYNLELIRNHEQKAGTKSTKNKLYINNYKQKNDSIKTYDIYKTPKKNFNKKNELTLYNSEDSFDYLKMKKPKLLRISRIFDYNRQHVSEIMKKKYGINNNNTYLESSKNKYFHVDDSKKSIINFKVGSKFLKDNIDMENYEKKNKYNIWLNCFNTKKTSLIKKKIQFLSCQKFLDEAKKNRIENSRYLILKTISEINKAKNEVIHFMNKSKFDIDSLKYQENEK
jgi:hypothetical protein